MKKALWTVLTVLVMSVVAYVIYCACIPESESAKIRKQYNGHLQSLDKSKFPEDSMYRTSYQNKSTDFQIALALAYNREKKPDDAIMLIEELIRQNKDPHYRLFGRLMPRGSWFYGFDAHYYEMLANAFDLKKDNDSRDKALMNKNQALSEEKRLSVIETDTGNNKNRRARI
jgi:predicted Zn-dependent protease